MINFGKWLKVYFMAACEFSVCQLHEVQYCFHTHPSEKNFGFLFLPLCFFLSSNFYWICFNDEMYYLLERGVGLGTNMCAGGGNVRIEK